MARAGTERWAGLAILAAALATRLLFWQATPDRAWAYSTGYKGDALVWLDYAAALERGVPFELGLPMRPPGTAYLMAALRDGSADGIAGLRLAWCVMGALTVWLLYLAARRAAGSGLAAGVGVLCAASTGLLLLSGSLDTETPYLLLVAGILWLTPALLEGQGADARTARGRPLFAGAARGSSPAGVAAAAWGGLNGLACLFRVEHALFVALVSPWLLARWWRAAGLRVAGMRAALAVAAFVLVLAPWHLAAWRAIAVFNEEEQALPPAAERAQQALEASLAGMSWSPEAQREIERLPAFARRTATDFVAATVRQRGRGRVEAQDLAILEEAFGYRPRPLAGHPFVALSGGLNFALANQGEASGGFSRAPLEAPPPLAGGSERYPAALVAGLPPADLALTYPPHLRVVDEGYALGWRWLAGHPAAAARLMAGKLARFWEGAALGFTGYGLPLGLSGARRAVDLVVPVGAWAAIWRWLLLVAALAGIAPAWRRAAQRPWLLFLVSKVLVTLAFYGYARQGASVAPVVAMLLVCGAAGALGRFGNVAAGPVPAAASGRRKLGRYVSAPVVALLLAVGIEAARWASRPQLLLDGRPVAGRDPWPAGDHGEHLLTVR